MNIKILSAIGIKTQKSLIMKTAGSWKNTDLDNDSLWEKILKKKPRNISGFELEP